MNKDAGECVMRKAKRKVALAGGDWVDILAIKCPLLSPGGIDTDKLEEEKARSDEPIEIRVRYLRGKEHKEIRKE